MKKVSTTTGDGVARAFLKAQASFFGSYRNALKIEPVSGEEVGICGWAGGADRRSKRVTHCLRSVFGQPGGPANREMQQAWLVTQGENLSQERDGSYFL